MHDNKLRLSPDVINKAEEIAETWGLKNARAAIEAVFRKYADDYQYGRQPMMAMFSEMQMQAMSMGDAATMMPATVPAVPTAPPVREPIAVAAPTSCKALNELDDLLGL
ncbi:hypothetical protein IQ266_02745 [filamentous cyanobacterium LEGE 11480]|uniref:Uncharacterized protein n=1 Tax=Romeriopsis navalis LEGE 11480 TaxID=2777977 RepID=A0A928VLE6_9CYAN|nr:hypothetical protein [Romeriopsis navalis]MBE9028675.1 hypothetical protein [Romeriopsis navalis LEGE 11480]